MLRLTFPARRWVQLASLFEQVDESINQLLVKQNVDLKLPIGEKFYVSVTTGYTCVDLREFYYHPTKGLNATKRWIAPRLNQWVTLKEVMQKLFVEYPILATTTHVCTNRIIKTRCSRNVNPFNSTNCSFRRQCSCLYTDRLVRRHLSRYAERILGACGPGQITDCRLVNLPIYCGAESPPCTKAWLTVWSWSAVLNYAWGLMQHSTQTETDCGGHPAW